MVEKYDKSLGKIIASLPESMQEKVQYLVDNENSADVKFDAIDFATELESCFEDPLGYTEKFSNVWSPAEASSFPGLQPQPEA